MEQANKREPVEVPELARPLQESVEDALRDPEKGSRISVELRVSGGMPSQNYYFHFHVLGGEVMESRIQSALTRQHRELKGASLDAADWLALLRIIRDSGILNLAREPLRFLPDTVVGYLEIADRESKHAQYFAADEEQAKVQNKLPPRQITQVVEAIYGLGSQLMDMPSVKP